MTARRPWVYCFSDPLPEGVGDAKALLGGKGASLKEMSRAGLAVPPGFTISTDCCRLFFEGGRRWPAGLEEEVRAALARLEAETGRTYGRGARPLVVSVRSGAAVSMPGMMDTLLNCGLHPALADEVGDTPTFWRTYIQFVRALAKTVHGVGEAAFEEAVAGPAGRGAVSASGGASSEARAGPRPMDRAAADVCLRVFREQTGEDVPADPWALLVTCINAVFASWHSERAVAYRRRNDVRGLAGTAVNVQAMFPSEVSGVLFTQDPNRLSANRMVIEASYGLGESVVSGDVDPDRFLVRRDDLTQVEAHVGRKACIVAALGDACDRDPTAPTLTREELADLCSLALRVEKQFGHPVDLEWGRAGGRLALLQARPIRGLDVAEDMEIAREEEVFRLRRLSGGRRKVWVMHNLAETLRAPMPLTWDVMRRFMRGSGGFGRLYEGLGYRPSAPVREEGFLDLVLGRVYADPDRLAGLFWDGMPLAYDLDALAADRTLLDRAPTAFDAGGADARFLTTLPRNLAGMWRAARRMRAARRDARRRFEEDVLPPYLDYVRRERERDLGALADEEVVALLRERERRVLDEFGPESLRPGFFGGLAFDALATLLGQLGGRDEGEALASTLTGGLEGDTTFEQDALLYRVARGEATLREFLDRFGHRCIGEMELAEPRWAEDPSYLEGLVVRLRASPGRSPADIHDENVCRRREAEARLPSVLAQWGGSSLDEDVARDLADAQALLPYRESGKHYLMMGYALLRQAVEELARRWDLGGGVYFLRLEELQARPADRRQTEERIARRRLRWRSLQRLDAPPVIDSERLEGLGLAPKVEAASLLVGAPIASGVATGTARIVLDPRQAGDLGTDYILVCSSTDPGWTPLFLNARGLVVERGGVLSHGAIVARDFGIPAVVCPDATRRLRPGAKIRVDGNHGRVVVLEGGGDHA